MATGNEKLEAGLLEWKKQKSKEGLNYAPVKRGRHHYAAGRVAAGSKCGSCQ